MEVKVMVLVFCYFAVLCFRQTSSKNILFITPVHSPSHHVWNRALALGLVERGHNLTMLTHETEKSALPKNFTILKMEGVYEMLASSFKMNDFLHMGVIESTTTWLKMTDLIINYDYKTSGFKELINYSRDFKFDLIIFDVTWVRYMYFFIEYFHYPPVVASTPFLLSPSISVTFGNYPITAQDPHQMMQYTNKMSFRERALNTLSTYFEVLYLKYIFWPKEEALVKKYYPKISHTLGELERNISVLLSNTDPILDFPMSLPPSIIPVGGLHANPPKPLPDNLKKIMDEAKNGVIYFSLGTNIRSDRLPSTVINAFINAFSKLPQVVLWKFESDIELSLPQNVIIGKWFPQNDILGHPNLKLFISHGGGLSSQECIYHGVPILGIPFFGDQERNINKLVLKKLGVALNPHELTLETIQEALTEILSNDTYAENAKILSRKFRDQPQSPLERAVFWSEYIMRHGNAEHLATPSRDMPFYQLANLDVLLLFTFCFLLSLFILFILFKIVLKMITGKTIQSSKIKQQ